MVYAEFGGQTECIMGNWKIENVEFISIVSGSLEDRGLFRSANILQLNSSCFLAIFAMLLDNSSP